MKNEKHLILDEDTHRLIKQTAAQEGVSMKILIDNLIKSYVQYLDDKGKR